MSAYAPLNMPLTSSTQKESPMYKNAKGIFVVVVVASLASAMLWSFSMQAAGPASRGNKGRAANNPGKENFDIRNNESKDAVSKLERRLEKMSSKQKEKNAYMKQAMRSANEKKRRSVPGLEVSFCPLTNCPEIIGMRGRGRKFLTPPSSQPRENIMRGFLNDNFDLFGMSPQQVAKLRKGAADYTNPNGRLSWMKMEQRWNGMRVFQGEMMAAFGSSGEMARIVGGFAPGPEEQELPTASKISAAAAVVAAAASVDVALSERDLFVKETFPDGRTIIFHPTAGVTDDIKVELMYFKLDAALATLAWSTVLWEDIPAYYMLVDAETGDLLWRKDITAEQTQPATYSVYNDDSPAPLSPSNAFPGSGIQGA